MARLLGAMTAIRYCFPGVGANNDWRIPDGPDGYTLEILVGQRLLALRQDEHGTWRPFKDEHDQYVESPAPVSSFVGRNGEARTVGALREVMNLEGWVQVQFSTTPDREVTYDAPLMDLSGISTPPTPKRY